MCGSVSVWVCVCVGFCVNVYLCLFESVCLSVCVIVFNMLDDWTKTRKRYFRYRN